MKQKICIKSILICCIAAILLLGALLPAISQGNYGKIVCNNENNLRSLNEKSTVRVNCQIWEYGRMRETTQIFSAED